MKRCPHADEAKLLIFGKNGESYCRSCWEQFGRKSGDHHVYSGRKIWLGSEVYGKKLGSDELRADTERDILKKNWPSWFEQRIKDKHLNERAIRTYTS